jgi:hypothetical protein
MRTITDSEKRTLRLGSVVLAVYLAAFGGYTVWKKMEKLRTDYGKLEQDAINLRREIQPYENKVLLLEKLKGSLDPAKLSKKTLVADASSAIQKAAMTGGVQLGPIRESPPRPSAKELASMQLEGMGQPRSMISFLERLNMLGFPLLIDNVQIAVDPTKQGMVKLSLTIIILDYEQWKNEEVRRA